MSRADIQGKAQKLIDWAKGWEGFNDYLKLNALVNKEGDASLNIVANDRIIIEYIDGVCKREFTVQFKMVLPWSDGYDPVNIESEETASSLLDWLDKQWPDNVPEWDNCNIYEIVTTSNAPQLDFVREQDELAEYSVQIIIRYEE